MIRRIAVTTLAAAALAVGFAPAAHAAEPTHTTDVTVKVDGGFLGDKFLLDTEIKV